MWFYQGYDSEARQIKAIVMFNNGLFMFISIPWVMSMFFKEAFVLNFTISFNLSSLCWELFKVLVLQAWSWSQNHTCSTGLASSKDYTDYRGWGKIYVLPSLTLDLATASSFGFSHPSNIWYHKPIFIFQKQTYKCLNPPKSFNQISLMSIKKAHIQRYVSFAFLAVDLCFSRISSLQ